MSDLPPDISHDQHAVRRQKLADLRAAEQPIRFAPIFAPTHFSQEAIKLYVEGQDNVVPAAVAGRLVVIRDMGKSQFVKILDQQGQIQLFSDPQGRPRRRGLCGIQETRPRRHHRRQGHFLFKTKAGEITLKVDAFTLVAKALHPLPEKWHGLTDPEQVYRQRYLDLIVNPESRKRLMLRSQIVAGIRRFLEARQFIEVETPVLQNIAGGAAARPFVTHHNALGASISSCGYPWSCTSKAPAGRRVRPRLRDRTEFPERGRSPGATIRSSPCSRSTRPTAIIRE